MHFSARKMLLIKELEQRSGSIRTDFALGGSGPDGGQLTTPGYASPKVGERGSALGCATRKNESAMRS